MYNVPYGIWTVYGKVGWKIQNRSVRWFWGKISPPAMDIDLKLISILGVELCCVVASAENIIRRQCHLFTQLALKKWVAFIFIRSLSFLLNIEHWIFNIMGIYICECVSSDTHSHAIIDSLFRIKRRRRSAYSSYTTTILICIIRIRFVDCIFLFLFFSR